jgi:hypothetical protein
MRTARRSPRPTAARWGPRAAPAAGSPCTMFSGAIGFLFSSLRRLLQFWALLPLGVCFWKVRCLAPVYETEPPSKLSAECCSGCV